MFRSNLLLEASKPGQWIVRRPLVWAICANMDNARGCCLIIVPPGFVTDLASVPRFLRDRKAFDVNGASRRPAVLHDYLYATGMLGKEEADNIFRQALRAEGVGAVTAWAFYQAVHWFGGAPYREHARQRDIARAARRSV